MNRRVALFLSILAVCIFFGFFIFPKAVEWRLKEYFKEKFDSELHYSGVTWTKEGLLFSQVELESKKEAPVSFQLDATRIQVGYRLRPFDLRLELNVELVDPHLILKQKQGVVPIDYLKEKLEKAAAEPSLIFAAYKTKHSHLFKSNISVVSARGVFELYDTEDALILKKPFDFQATFGSAPEVEESFLFKSDEQLQLQYERNRGKLVVQNASLKELFEAFQFFVSNKGFSIPSGFVSGQVAFEDCALQGALQMRAVMVRGSGVNVAAKLPLASLNFRKKETQGDPEAAFLERCLEQTEIDFALTEEATLFGSTWNLANLRGGFSVHEKVASRFNGTLFFGMNDSAPFQINAEMPLHLHEAHMGLLVGDFGASFSLQGKEIDFAFNQLGPKEFDLAKHIVPKWVFVWNEVNFIKGSLSGHLRGTLLPNNTLSTFNVEQVEGKDLWFTSKSLHIDGYVERLSGNMEFALQSKEGHMNPRNGSITLSEGDLYWDRREENEETSLERLTHLNCSVTISNGVLQEGKFTGNLAGMQAELEFFGINQDKLARMQLKGSLHKFLKQLPFSFPKDLDKAIHEETMTWSGELTHAPLGLELTSQLHVTSPGGEPLTVDLSATLERVAKKEWEKMASKWQRWGLSLVEKEEKLSVPIQRKASNHILKVSWLKDEKGPWGITLKQGVIKSERFPLNPYLTPLVSHEDELSGMLKFSGDFNDRSLLVHFQIADFALENKYLKVRLEEVGYTTSQGTLLSDPTSFFYMDFQDEIAYGFIPVKKGSYLDKSNQLLYEQVETLISFSKNRIQLASVQTVSEGVFFAGTIDLDLSSDEMMKLHIHAKDVDGDVTSVQKFCSHFSGQELWHLPLEGQLRATRNGVVVDGLIPKDERKGKFTWTVEGKLQEGYYPFAFARLEDLKAQFSYQSQHQDLHIQDVEGKLFVASGKEYTLLLPDLQLQLDRFALFDFDLTLRDETGEFAKLAGSLLPQGEAQEEIISFTFRNDTHIGGIYPHIDTVVLKDFKKLEFLRASPVVHVQTLHEDLAFLSELGLIPFPNGAVQFLENARLKGIVKGPITYNGVNVRIDLEGENISTKGRVIDRCALKVESSGSEWKISTLQFGTFTLTALLDKKDNEIQVVSIQAEDPGLQLKASGQYSELSKALSLHIDPLTVSIADLSGIKRAKGLMRIWNPQGKISFTGNLRADFKESEFKMGVQGTASLEGVEVRGNRIQNQGSIPISYTTDEGLKIEGLLLNVRQKDEVQKGSFSLKKAQYDFEEETLQLVGFGFSLSSNYFRELIHLCQEFFPDLVDERTALFLKDLRSDGGLSGYLDIEIKETQVFVAIHLRDGKYQLFGKEADLRGIVIHYTPQTISFQGTTPVGEMPIHVLLSIQRPDTSRGTVVVTSGAHESNPLTASLEWNEDGVHIKKMEGALAGLYFSGKEKAPDVLAGKIWLQEIQPLRAVLSKGVKEALDTWKIGKGYAFSFELNLPHQQEPLSFRGTLEGANFIFLGAELDHLRADVQYVTNRLSITGLVIQDSALHVQVPTIACVRENHEWQMHMPFLKVKEFKPASLFTLSKSMRNLVVHDAELRDFKGVLGNSASFTGGGFFAFEKVVKSSLGNILLSIPADILSHLGLNLSAMSPAMGTIQFAIKDRRFYITKMIEVYSENKASRFLLPKAPLVSYVDFDGNLNIYIRMKQYNLLLKLTEALLIHIQGRWDNPTINFERNINPSS